MVKASINIPSRNRTQDLRRCIQLLLPQLPADGSVTIEVCDDGTTDETRRMLEENFPMVGWRQGPKNGPAANRNLSARSSKADWLIYLDDDCIPRSRYVAAYLEAFASPNGRGLFHGLTYPMPDFPSLYYEAPYVRKPEKIFPSCNFGISKKLFDETGGFDERYNPSFEDIEYFTRLGLLGVDAQCVSEAIVDHPIRPIPDYQKLAARWETRVISTMDLRASPLQVAILLPKHVLLVILSRFRGQKLNVDNLKAAVAFAMEFFCFMGRLPGWISKHSRSPRSPFWGEMARQGRGPYRFGL